MVTVAFDNLRAELDARGLTPFDVQLPDEKPSVAPLEGALRLRGDQDSGYVLESVDSGRGYWLGQAATESEACELLLRYVSRPLPPLRPLSRDQLDELIGRVAPHYFDLRD